MVWVLSCGLKKGRFIVFIEGSSKTMTVTKMATPRGPILVTVDTFDALGGGGEDTIGGEGGWERGAQTHIEDYMGEYYSAYY